MKTTGSIRCQTLKEAVPVKGTTEMGQLTGPGGG